MLSFHYVHVICCAAGLEINCIEMMTIYAISLPVLMPNVVL